MKRKSKVHPRGRAKIAWWIPVAWLSALAQAVSGSERLLLGPEPLALPAPATDLLALDLRGEGPIDLVAAHATRTTVSVFLGDGAGGFGPLATYPAGLGPALLVSGDFDGDGHLDILALSRSALSARVLRNLGDGTFGPGCEVQLGTVAEGGDAGDVNRDGSDDVLVWTRSPRILRLFLSDGGCALRPAGTLSVAGPILCAAAGGGHGTAEPAAWLLEDLGGGAVAARSLRATEAGGLEVADSVNESLRAPPIAAAAGKALAGELEGFALLLEDGSVAFLRVLAGGGARVDSVSGPIPGAEPSAAAWPLRALDVNGDGMLDVTVTFERGGQSVGGLYPGRGDGTFGPLDAVALGIPKAAATAMTDLDLDRKVDGCAVSSASPILVLARGSSGPGAEDSNALVPVDASGADLVPGDFDEDGAADLVLRDRDRLVFVRGDGKANLGRGTESVLPRLESLPGLLLEYGPMAGSMDSDGDGHLDLCVRAYSPLAGVAGHGSVVVAFGDGTGAFPGTSVYGIGPQPGPIAVGDFDRDGLDDLAVTDLEYVEVAMLFGSRTRLGRVGDGIALGGVPVAIACADLDGDGDLDLVVATAERVSALFGDGHGGFPLHEALFDLPFARWLEVDDYDSDGTLDVAALAEDSLRIVGDVLGGITGGIDVPLGAVPEAIEFVDLDGDGLFDILALAGRPRILSVHRGQARGGFAPPERYWVGSEPLSTAAVDLGGDGALDVVVSDGGAKAIRVLRNTLLPDRFRRGDADGDSRVSITDAVVVLRSLFLGGGDLSCPDAADSNDDGALSVTDPVYLLRYLFQGGPEPPDPGPIACGRDPTPDELPFCEDPCR